MRLSDDIYQIGEYQAGNPRIAQITTCLTSSNTNASGIESEIIRDQQMELYKSWQYLSFVQTDSLCFRSMNTNQYGRVSGSSSQSALLPNMRLSYAIAIHWVCSCSYGVIFRTTNGSAPIRRQRVSELKFPEAYELQILVGPFKPHGSICCCLTVTT